MMSALFAGLVIFFAFPKIVNAQIVINEFSAKTDPEWVELYNTSNTSVNLDGWEIADGNTKSTDDLTISGTISADGFMVFEHPKGWLNDSGDTVKLYNNATPSGELQDSYTYSSADAETTTSRVPDGSGDFTYDTDSTKGEANQAPPTPIPTEEPTSAPTLTPAPILTQTPTLTPTQDLPSGGGTEGDSLGVEPVTTPSSEVLSVSTSSSPYSVFFQESTISAVSRTQHASPGAKTKTNMTLVGLGIATLSGSILFFRNSPY
jgi:hypothetical protein